MVHVVKLSNLREYIVTGSIDATHALHALPTCPQIYPRALPMKIQNEMSPSGTPKPYNEAAGLLVVLAPAHGSNMIKSMHAYTSSSGL